MEAEALTNEKLQFLSTPSARRATYSIPGLVDHH